MENASSNIWTALRNSVFRRFWFATVISGSCVAAQSTARCYHGADLRDGYGFCPSRRPLHLTGGRNRRHRRPQADLVSSSDLAGLDRLRSGASMGGALTESLSHPGEHISLERRFCV